MKPLFVKATAIVLGATAIAAVFFAGTRYAPHTSAPVAATAAEARDRVHLDANAPQRAFLQVAAAVGAPLPAAGPFNGRLVVNEDATSRIYAPVAGRITRLVAGIGDRVVTGALLAELDAPEFGAAIADAQKADAEAARKQSALQRARTLFAGEAIARRELEDAEADAAAARAEANRAAQRLGNLAPVHSQFQGERLPLRSPLTGIVVDRQANPGSEARPDAAVPLFVVSDVATLWLTLDLGEKDVSVHVGDTIRFSVDALPGESFTARADKVSPVLDPVTRRISVRATVDNRSGKLRPEMYVRAVAAAPDAAPTLRVPTSAMFTQGLQSAVFVAEASGDFVRRRVKVLHQDSDFAYLATDSDLKPDETVVTHGVLLLASELAGSE